MCRMSVVVEENGVEEMVLENVTRLQISGTTIEVSAFFEEPRRLEAVFIESIDFLAGKLVLKKSAA
ncbi:MAG: CooT family nickel-binding protein [Desulfoarculaceae bacterium]|nr:CooT family nickel-binding protein [Desulfoarculaceae bacterium]